MRKTMTVQINEIEYCKINAKYSADPEVVKEKRQDALSLVKKQVKDVRGFRKGHVPDIAYKTRYKKQMEDMIKRELVALAYEEILFETKMKPIGHPNIISADLLDNGFYCDLLFLKKPDVTLKQYKDFEIPKPPAMQTINDIFMKMLQDVREKYAVVTPYSETDFVQAGDSLTIDLACSVDDKPLDKFTKQGVFYSTVESDLALLLPEFNKQIYGMTLDSERTFDIKLPETFGDLADKMAKFTIKLHMGTKKRIPPVDDEMAQSEGHQDKKELGNVLMGKAQAQYANQQRALIQNQVITRLLSLNEVKVPEWLVENEAKGIAQQNNITIDQLQEAEVDKLIEVAENRVKLSLILDSIREAEPQAVFSDEELIGGLKNNLKENGADADKVIEKARLDGTLFGVLASLRDDTTIQWILDHSKVIE